ncbi:hypothetical protein [Caballeronia sp. LZ034LL]|uniref:hypothetical protein n=1 Tax=Caballeronia sp. LZ034LL TaxID=3038567 RepID=UPI00285EBC92|nr:hypothetical protein [Caballeronia sp. LZ034LL]MDR5836651.1 hypothetical protein [Caballeronia sp. LZ034LL]
MGSQADKNSTGRSGQVAKAASGVQQNLLRHRPQTAQAAVAAGNIGSGCGSVSLH